MENLTLTRLAALRALMKSKGIDAMIIPQADPHLGEYLAAHWQVRRWLSGFTGSAGDMVVTADKAALWTDSRYFLQATDQLAGSSIELMKDGLADTPSMMQYITEELKPGQTVGLDGMLFPSAQLAQIKAALSAKGLKVNAAVDIIDEIWTDRPALPDGKIFIHEEKYSGESVKSKIAKVLAEAAADGAEAVFVSALDEIAWLLNIRCNDVKHTPVATAFLFIADNESTLFIDSAKLTDATAAYLASQGVKCRAYTEVKSFLGSLSADSRVLVDPTHTAGAIMDILGQRAKESGISAAARLKSVKNPVQLAGIHAAMVRDGVAMVKSLMEIEQRIADSIHTEETDIAEILRRHRSVGQYYFDESFETIAGYGPHGAIVHYTADDQSSSTLEPHGLLLIDSGAQYLDGTTDITRTIALGEPTDQERSDFTLVMKGHIALATAIFPEGTRGAQLDVLARQFLWRQGLSYLHGTGHGVGHFLSVHEGPHSIRLNNVEAPLRPGCITSNEPGLYREGIHGIRCENLVLCANAMHTEFGQFLMFETITLCPFDRSLFDLSMMTAEEIEWVNGYHALVAERLMPALENEQQRTWLAEKTKPLA